MLKTRLIAIATALLCAAPLAAQAVVQVTPGSSSNTTAVTDQVSANEMTGMRITATLADGQSGFATWGLLSGSTWGADIFGQDGRQIARVAMTPGTADTFFSDWLVTLYQRTDLTSLQFQGGAGYGGVLFDRASPPLGLGTGTAGSGLGRDFDLNDANWSGITATYTDVVTLNGNPWAGDLFSHVSVDFTNAEWCTAGLLCLAGLGWNSDVPDANGPNANPFGFRMDTDLGRFPAGNTVVPEPSTYVLMAAGLAVLGIAARRRNKRA